MTLKQNTLIMNRSNIFKLIAFNLLAIFFLQSCSKNEVTPSGSRAVKYEIAGDYTGSIIVAAVVANGSFETFEVKKQSAVLKIEPTFDILLISSKIKQKLFLSWILN